MIMFLALTALFIQTGRSQDTIRMELGGVPVDAVVTDGDTVLVSMLDEAVIQPKVKIATTRDMRQYRRLVYNVKRVYPYAKLAGARFAEVSAHMDSLETRKEQREYIKQIEKEILEKYQEDLKDLTITQGRILIKLIDRETSETSYNVVKELRGSFQAAFWQAVARIFGSNLKTEFGDEAEDKMINDIMVMIERGLL